MAPEICTKSWVKNSQQNFLPLHVVTLWWNCSSRWCFLWSFLTASKPIRRPITAAKRKEKGKKEKRKKNSMLKNKKSPTWKDVGHFLVSTFWFLCTLELSQNVVKRDASGKKASCHIADAFLTRLRLIWPISSLKISKMSKKSVFGKKLQESMG